MTTLAESARDIAMNTTGDRVAVVLATLPGPGGRPTWGAYPMRSAADLAAWFDDWAGTPDLFLYLAAFDKTSRAWLDDGAPVRATERHGAAVASAGVRYSDVRAQISPFSILQNLIAQHEVFFGDLAQQNPHSGELRSFLSYAWDPFYAQWVLLVTQHGLSDADQDLLREEAAKLAAIRDYAVRHRIPVPSLTQGADMSSTKISGGRGGSGGGGGLSRGAGYGGVRDHRSPAPPMPPRMPPAPVPPPAPPPRSSAPPSPSSPLPPSLPPRDGYGYGGHGGYSDYDRYRDHREPRYPVPGFYGRGGFYRHGSAYPGRWWRGYNGYPVWIESDINLILDAEPSVDDDLPPPSVDDQPIAQDAQGDAPIDRAPDAPDDTTGDADADQAAAAVQGWRDVIAPFLISGRANAAAAPAGSRVIDLAPVLAPGTRPMQLSFAIDGDALTATVAADGKTYQATADLTPIWATLEPRLAAWHDRMHEEARLRGHTLMGFSSQYNVSDAARVGAGSGAALIGSQGSPRSKILQALDGYRGGGLAHALVGAGVSVSGGCGTRTYGNVTPQVIGAILRGLKDRGADVTGSNPWYAVTHDHGVEFRGTWDRAQQTLAIEVTDSDFYVPCSKVWEAIEPMLADQGASPTASLEREIGETNEQIRALSQSLVAGILDAHAGAYCAGWLDSITNALGDAAKGVARGVVSAANAAAGTVGHTLVKLRGPIAAAAGVAAGAGALKIPGVGPFVAPMAGSLASSIVDAAAGSGDAQRAAQAAVTAAAAAAPTDALVAKALGLAQKAAAQATAGYHVTQTAANAAAGSVDAQKQLQELVAAANGGDQGAQKALEIASSASGAVGGAAQKAQAAQVAGAFNERHRGRRFARSGDRFGGRLVDVSRFMIPVPHDTEICAGWWDDLTHKVKSAVSSVAHAATHPSELAHDAAHYALHPSDLVKKTAAGLGAGAGLASALSYAVNPMQDLTENAQVQDAMATIYGGPLGPAALQAARGVEGGQSVTSTLQAMAPQIALAAAGAAGAKHGPAASGLAGALVTSAVGTGDAAKLASQVVQAANKAAAKDPAAKSVIDAARQAVAQATAAYHATEVAKRAAAGSTDAKTQLAELANAASAGDPAARATLDVAASASTAAAAASAATPAGDGATAAAGWFAPLFAGLGGLGAGYFGPDVYHWAKAKWDAHKAHP